MKRAFIKRLLNSFLPILLLLTAIFILLIFVEFQASLDAQKIEVIHISKQEKSKEDLDEDYLYDLTTRDYANEPLFDAAKKAFEKQKYKKAERLYYELLAQKPSAEIYNLLGLTLAKQGLYKKALAAYHSSLQYDKKYYRAYYNRAYLYSVKEDYTKAITDYKKSTIYQPFHFKSFYNLGLAQYKSKKYNAATRSFDKAISLSSGERKSKALYQKALCYLKYEHPKKEKAKFALNKAIRIQPNALLPRLLLIKLDNDKKAQIQALQALAKLHPNNILPVEVLARWYKEEQRTLEAHALYKNYLQKQSKNAKALYSYARFLYDLDQFDKAKNYLTQTLEIDPQDLESQLLMAKIFHKSGNYTNAIAEYKKALKLQKGLSQIYLEMSLSYKRLKDKKQQLWALKKALTHNEKNSKALFEMGKYAMYSKQYKKAKRYLNKSIKINDAATASWYTIGELLSRQDKDNEALKAFRHALKLNPHHTKAQMELARHYYKTNDFNQSVQLHTEILAKDSKNITAWEYLGRSYYRLKIYDKAEEAITKGLKISPDSINLKKQLAKIYQKTQRAKEASEIFSQLIDQDPSNILMHYNFAKALKKNEEYQRALKAVNHVLALKPNHARAKNLKFKIEEKLKGKE